MACVSVLKAWLLAVERFCCLHDCIVGCGYCWSVAKAMCESAGYGISVQCTEYEICQRTEVENKSNIRGQNHLL